MHVLVHRANQQYLGAAREVRALIPDNVLRHNTRLLDKFCIFLVCVRICALLKVSPFHFRLVFEVMDLYLGLFCLFFTRTCEMKSSIDDGVPQEFHLRACYFRVWIGFQDQGHKILIPHVV